MRSLTATADELSKAMGIYAHRSEAALASFMEKASARGLELEASAVARLNQFRGLPANGELPASGEVSASGGLPDVNDGPLADPPTNTDRVRIVAAAERAVADGLHFASDGDRKPQSGRPMTLVKSEPAA
jgi:hypothetical protein